MKAKKPTEQASHKAAAKTTSSPKRKTKRKGSAPAKPEQAHPPEEDQDDSTSQFMKGCKTAESEQPDVAPSLRIVEADPPYE